MEEVVVHLHGLETLELGGPAEILPGWPLDPGHGLQFLGFGPGGHPFQGRSGEAVGVQQQGVGTVLAHLGQFTVELPAEEEGGGTEVIQPPTIGCLGRGWDQKGSGQEGGGESGAVDGKPHGVERLRSSCSFSFLATPSSS